MLGAKYGYIVTEDNKPTLVFSLRDASINMKKLEEEGRISSAESRKVGTEMVMYGILLTLKEVCDLAVNLSTPRHYTPILDFEMCEGASCGLSLPHGFLKSTFAPPSAEPILPVCDLATGFYFLFGSVGSQNTSPLDAVICLQKMVRAGLPTCSTEEAKKEHESKHPMPPFFQDGERKGKMTMS